MPGRLGGLPGLRRRGPREVRPRGGRSHLRRRVGQGSAFVDGFPTVDRAKFGNAGEDLTPSLPSGLLKEAP